MTTENVKKLFNISNSTLYRWSSERDVLPKIKIGRKVYFKGEDIERLIK
jgi:excisionase family DNA binding protein